MLPTSGSPFHQPARGWLERQRSHSNAWYTSWSILYEFLRVTTHPRVMRRPWSASAAWEFVTALLPSPALSVLAATQRHAAVAAEVVRELPHLAGNLLHDAHTAILMHEHGIGRICTRDTDFTQFPFLEVIDPVRWQPNGSPADSAGTTVTGRMRNACRPVPLTSH
jgi:uncharacterized protein